MADSREYRSRFLIQSITFLGILVGILIAAYFLRNPLSAAKLDLTEDKIFTISPETKDILKGLTDDITVRYWCSDQIPSSFENLKRDTLDMFRELESISSHFKWEVVAPEEEARRDAAQKVEEYY